MYNPAERYTLFYIIFFRKTLIVIVIDKNRYASLCCENLVIGARKWEKAFGGDRTLDLTPPSVFSGDCTIRRCVAPPKTRKSTQAEASGLPEPLVVRNHKTEGFFHLHPRHRAGIPANRRVWTSKGSWVRIWCQINFRILPQKPHRDQEV